MASPGAAPYDLPIGAGAHALPRRRRTASGIEDLLEQASDHVATAMQQFDCDEQRRSSISSSDSTAGAPFVPPVRRGKSVRAILVAILRRSLGGKTAREDETQQGKRRKADEGEGEYQYRRLRNGFTGLLEHVQALDKSREGLKRAVVQLRLNGVDLERIVQEASDRGNGDGRASLSVSLSSYASALSDVETALDERVAPITQTKLLQLQRFQIKLSEREALKAAVAEARLQLTGLQDAFSAGKRGVTVDQLRVANHRFHRLRRCLEAMTAALEHVFRLHYQLDQCVADPELRIVHHELSRLFARCLQTLD